MGFHHLSFHLYWDQAKRLVLPGQEIASKWSPKPVSESIEFMERPLMTSDCRVGRVVQNDPQNLIWDQVKQLVLP